jgi:hypothetical protein
MPMPHADASARCRIGQLRVSIAQSVLLLGQRRLARQLQSEAHSESDSIAGRRRRLRFGAPGPARVDVIFRERQARPKNSSGMRCEADITGTSCRTWSSSRADHDALVVRVDFILGASRSCTRAQ